jgi:hypothetical protein
MLEQNAFVFLDAFWEWFVNARDGTPTNLVPVGYDGCFDCWKIAGS